MLFFAGFYLILVGEKNCSRNDQKHYIMEIAAARVSQEIYRQIPLQAVYEDVAEPNSLQRREEMLFRMLMC